MLHLLRERLNVAFGLTLDLYKSLQTDHLRLKIGNLPSNDIGQQVWCIIGARESYLKAIKNGEWTGFSCSLSDTTDKSQITTLLEDTTNQLHEVLVQKSQFTEIQLRHIFLLYEHEIQHHGQLIRYFYSNKLTFPKSWNTRYTV